MKDWKETTGKSLQQWGDLYGVSRERIRQQFNKYGTCDPIEISQLKLNNKKAIKKILEVQ